MGKWALRQAQGPGRMGKWENRRIPGELFSPEGVDRMRNRNRMGMNRVLSAEFLERVPETVLRQAQEPSFDKLRNQMGMNRGLRGEFGERVLLKIAHQ